MADFDFVTPRLATGAAVSSRADVDQLAKAGITLVIDCRAEFNDAPPLASHPSISYVWDGVQDDGQPKPDSWFGKGIDAAPGELRKPKGKVYAHCAAGHNRGPSMAYAVMRPVGFSAKPRGGLHSCRSTAGDARLQGRRGSGRGGPGVCVKRLESPWR